MTFTDACRAVFKECSSRVATGAAEGYHGVFFLFFVFTSDVPCRGLGCMKATDQPIALNRGSLDNRKSKYVDTGNIPSPIFSANVIYFSLKLIS